SSPPEAPYAAPAASPRPLASLHPWQTTRRPSPCPSGPPLLVVASQPADEGAPPFGSGILTNSWAHIGLHPWPQLRESSTPLVVERAEEAGAESPNTGRRRLANAVPRGDVCRLGRRLSAGAPSVGWGAVCPLGRRLSAGTPCSRSNHEFASAVPRALQPR